MKKHAARRALIFYVLVIGCAWTWALLPHSEQGHSRDTARTVHAASFDLEMAAAGTPESPHRAEALPRKQFEALANASRRHARQRETVVAKNVGQPTEPLGPRFDAERSDPQWTLEVEDYLTQSIAAAGLAAEPVEVDCRETLCRVGLRADDLAAGQQLLEAASRPDQRITLAKIQPSAGRTLFEVFVDRPEGPPSFADELGLRAAPP